MAKTVDKNGNVVENPDLSKGYLTPLETVHHDAQTHTTTTALPGGMVITNTVTDAPAYDEVTVYLYTEYAPTDAEKMAAQVTYTAMMTDTLLDSEV